MTGRVGHFTTVDNAADASWFIAFTDRVNATPVSLEVRQAMIDALRPLTGRRVLDIGCGPGENARELASHAGPSGTVVGADVSEAMLAEARRRGGPVEFTH